MDIRQLRELENELELNSTQRSDTYLQHMRTLFSLSTDEISLLVDLCKQNNLQQTLSLILSYMDRLS